MPGMTQGRAARHPNRLQASMRPRLNAGDDLAHLWLILGVGIGFNEAPAKCRG